MPAATFNLTGDNVIEQGSGWEILIKHPGNMTQSSMKAQIRPHFDGNVLAEFRFDAPTFNVQLGQTTFRMWLAASQTQKLNPTKPNEPYRYDVLMYGSLNGPIRILQGTVEVSPGVTE